MKIRLLVGLLLLGTLAHQILLYGHWVGPGSQSILKVHHALFSRDGEESSPTDSLAVPIPHRWPYAIAEGHAGIYRIKLPDTQRGAEDWALSISDYMPGTEVFFKGQRVPKLHLTGHMGEVFLTDLGPVTSGDDVELRVPSHFGMWGGLGSVRLGPTHLLARQARIQSIVREVSHLWEIGMSLAVAMFALAVYWFRSDSLLLALGAVATGIFARLIMPYISGYWQEDGIELALFASSNSLAVIGMYFLMEYGSASPKNSASYLALLLFPLVLWIHFHQIGDLEQRRILNAAFIVFLCISSLIRFGRTIIKEKNWLLLWLLAIFTLRTVSGVASMITNHALLGFDETEQQTRPFPLGVLIAMLFAARHIYLSMRNYKLTNLSLSKEIEAYKDELAAISEREKALAIEQAATTERLHWMQEIHDGLGSHLVAARFLADRATQVEDVKAIRNSIDEGIEELREIVESLSSETSTVPSLLGAMRYRIMTRFESGGLTLQWNVDPMIEALELTPAAALNVQRIIQEALTNILKHAHPTTVSVHIFTRKDTIVVRIDDDGKGFDMGRQFPGRGIQGMTKRAKACNGEATWIRLDPGTRFELTLPNR
jgi:signal transduction histidine kinase